MFDTNVEWKESVVEACEEETVVCQVCGKQCEVPCGDYQICMDCYYNDGGEFA